MLSNLFIVLCSYFLILLTHVYIAVTMYRKYEEISPPHLEDFVYITDNTYTKEEMVKMESDVLNSLKFEVGNPTVKTFLR